MLETNYSLHENYNKESKENRDTKENKEKETSNKTKSKFLTVDKEIQHLNKKNAFLESELENKTEEFNMLKKVNIFI